MKNTLSILENIKKKITKLDEPRGEDKKNFADLDDEFEYIDDVKDGEEHSIHSSEEQKNSQHDVMLEHEIENSFPEEEDEEDPLFDDEEIDDGKKGDSQENSDEVASFMDEEDEIEPEISEELDGENEVEKVEVEENVDPFESENDDFESIAGEEIKEPEADLGEVADLQNEEAEVELSEEVSADPIAEERDFSGVEADAVENKLPAMEDDLEGDSEDLESSVEGISELDSVGGDEEIKKEVFEEEFENYMDNDKADKEDSELKDEGPIEDFAEGGVAVDVDLNKDSSQAELREQENDAQGENNSDDELFAELDEESSVSSGKSESGDLAADLAVDNLSHKDDNLGLENNPDEADSEDLSSESQISDDSSHKSHVQELAKENEELNKMLEENDEKHYDQIQALKGSELAKSDLGEEVESEKGENEENFLQESNFDDEINSVESGQKPLDEHESGHDEEDEDHHIDDHEIDDHDLDIDSPFDENNESDDVEDSIIGQGLAEKVSDSIHNLVEAKHMVKKVDTFVKNDLLTGVAQDLMRPKLEKWFEENLPELVEKVVREEIKKIILKDQE